MGYDMGLNCHFARQDADFMGVYQVGVFHSFADLNTICGFIYLENTTYLRYVSCWVVVGTSFVNGVD